MTHEICHLGVAPYIAFAQYEALSIMADAAAAAPTLKPLPTVPPYGDNAIEVSNLTFSYRSDASGSTLVDPNKPENVVLRDMNLALQTGSRCLLIGANGSGALQLIPSVPFTFLPLSASTHCVSLPLRTCPMYSTELNRQKRTFLCLRST